MTNFNDNNLAELFSEYQRGYFKTTEEDNVNIIERALVILSNSFKTQDIKLAGPTAVKDYLKLKIGRLEKEVFGILMLNPQNQLIKDVILFEGTIAHCSIYTRELVKEALLNNAISVVIYHNHPSGNEFPSKSDFETTNRIREALLLVDVNLCDHIIVAKNNAYSFKENGIT